MGSVWGTSVTVPVTINTSYYYSSSSNDFVRSVSQEWLDRSWWNFTGIMRVTWIVANNVNMFQYGCRCHGNDKNIQNSLISIFSGTVRLFIIRLHTNVNHHEPLLLHHITTSKMSAVTMETACIWRERNMNFLFWKPLDRLRWNFTETITAIDRCVSNVKKFQNGCRCHGNHKSVYNSLISFF
jgi:hypothetical protein